MADVGTHKVVVIGGGIVGTAAAAAIVRTGREVVLVERAEIGGGCSSGNSGLIVVSGCVPHALPGVLGRLPGHLLQKSGPLSIRPGHLLTTLPWFLAMLRASRLPNVQRIAAALAAMAAQAKRAAQDLALAAGCAELIRDTGTIHVYDSEQGRRDAALAFALRRDNGVAMQELSGDELRELEPGAPSIFCRGVLIPGNAYCTDPERLVKAVGRFFQAQQGQIIKATVRAIEPTGSGVRVHTDGAGPIEADTVVVAAGAWTGPLLRPLGARLLIQPHRGYHVMVPGASDRLGYPLLWEQKGFAIVPMAQGLRAAGTVEIAAADAPPNPARAEQIALQLGRAMADLDLAKATTWMGVRPATPDSLPYLGRLPGHANVLVAAGHNQLGLSLGAITGEAIRDLIVGRRPSFDLTPMAVDRFHQ